MIKIQVGELVEDFDLYPRDRINSYHVTEIAEAIKNGVDMPPIVCDKKSKRVSDGFHRRRAYLNLFGESYKVDVLAKAYRNEKELYLDALRYNANHGLRLDKHDKATALLKGEKLKIDPDTIGRMLHMSIDTRAQLRNTKVATGSGGELIAIKQTIRHKAGKRLNKQQQEANIKLSGMNQVFYVNQIITLIESDLLDTDNETLMERLEVLKDLLISFNI